MIQSRTEVVTALLLCCGSLLNASNEIDVTPLQNHPCGDPFRVSSAYSVFDAKVDQVLNCSTLLVTLYAYPYVNVDPPPITREVRLAGIEAHPDDPALCTSFLSEHILGNQVELLANGSKSVDDTDLPVVISVDPPIGQLNRHLLSSGLARYATSAPYELNSWDDCDYRRAETSARESRIGVWLVDESE